MSQQVPLTSSCTRSAGLRSHRFGSIDPGSFVVIRTVRGGLVSLIPLLLVGALALVARSFFGPVSQEFSSQSSFDVVYDLSSFIYFATYGMLSIFATISIARSYVVESDAGSEQLIGSVMAALACFSILSGVLTDTFTFDAFGTKGMFLALACGLLAPMAYVRITNLSRARWHFTAAGSDAAFMNALRAFAPLLCILVCCALMEFVIVIVFGTGNLYQLFVSAIVSLFDQMGRSVLSGLFFVVVSSVLWFFGIHGSDVFEGAVSLQFTPAIDINQAAVAAGQMPTEILTKTFFDTFVLMGGCGSAWCLVIALILFSRRSGLRILSRTAAVPMIFNVNETVVFGLPIVFNPWLLVPFVAVPTLNYLIAYGATAIGLVPMTTTAVEWTTPVLMSGWIATGSVAGPLLQLFLLALGTVVYAPFVKRYNAHLENEEHERLDHLVARLKEVERTLVPVDLAQLEGDVGAMARSLTSELRQALHDQQLQLAFQPQFDVKRECLGAEALLRWNHPRLGVIYPPLVIKLALEAGFLLELEQYVLERSCEAAQALRPHANGRRLKMSVNVCSSTLGDPAYEQLVDDVIERFDMQPHELCLELTEQMAFEVSDAMKEAIDRMKAQGVVFAVDDFSMGHTSLKYLQSGQFDWVKLDGTLVVGLPDDENATSIISSVIHLARAMGFAVIAEYVETEEQRSALEGIGCSYYQGYLFSPAVPLEDYIRCVEQSRTVGAAEVE